MRAVYFSKWGLDGGSGFKETWELYGEVALWGYGDSEVIYV